MIVEFSPNFEYREYIEFKLDLDAMSHERKGKGLVSVHDNKIKSIGISDTIEY